MKLEPDGAARRGPAWERLLLPLERELVRLGVKREGCLFDLTPLPNAVAIDLLKFLSGSGLFLLHGSNSEQPYTRLLPQQANDASKESGNRKAVYATSDARIALTHAIINHGYLQRELTSYTHGYEVDGDRFIVKVTPDLYWLFLAQPPRLFADGYVYVLDRLKFEPAGGTNNEFLSEQDQQVALVFRVSRRLKETLFVAGRGEADTVLPYSEEELLKISAVRNEGKL